MLQTFRLPITNAVLSEIHQTLCFAGLEYLQSHKKSNIPVHFGLDIFFQKIYEKKYRERRNRALCFLRMDYLNILALTLLV